MAELAYFLLWFMFSSVWYGTAYRIVRVVDTSDQGVEDHMNGKIFLLNHGEASVIHHNETIVELGYSSDPSLHCEDVGENGIHSWRKYNEKLPVLNRNKACVDTVDVSVVSRMKRGRPVPKLHHKIDNLDEAMMWEMRKIDLIQGQMVYDKTFIDVMINPSVIKWHDYLIVSTGLTWRIRSAPVGPAGKFPAETIEFGIRNASTLTGPALPLEYAQGNVKRGARKMYPLEPNATFLGLREQVDRLDHIVGGQDPRSFVIDDRHIGLVFTNRFTFRIRMSLCILSVNMSKEEAHSWRKKSDVMMLRKFPDGFVHKQSAKSTEQFFKSKDNQVPYGGMQDKNGHNLVVSHIFRDFETWNTRKDEKNWSPFLHRTNANSTRRLFMIQSIIPLVVVEPVWDSIERSGSKPGLVPIEVVSRSTIDYDISWWHHGSLRGGTNAVLIDDSYYLALFHSSCTIPGDGIFRSYFMGAYTFTKTEPFELMGVSALPFMDQDLYQGAYAEITNRHYDYVVFPMTLMVEDEDTLVLSFGSQDRYGFLGKLNLPKVLRTLVPVRPGNSEIYPGHNYTAY